MSNRWSYQVVQIKPGTWGGFKKETLETELNRMGAMGWELVNMTVPAAYSAAMLVFKRPQ